MLLMLHLISKAIYKQFKKQFIINLKSNLLEFEMHISSQLFTHFNIKQTKNIFHAIKTDNLL